MVRAQDIGNATVEAFHDAVGLGTPGMGPAMLDTKLCAELVELMQSSVPALALGDEAISKFLAIVGEDGADLEGGGLVQGVQETSGMGRTLAGIDPHEHPAGRKIDGHEQIAPFILRPPSAVGPSQRYGTS